MQAGSVLDGKYELVRQIGDGRLGAVWAGRNIRTERELAVKLLVPTGGEEEKQRLLREARAGGRIRHPNVLDVYDVAETETGSPFIVMELLHGETLAERMKRGHLRLDEALRYLRDVARGLGAAHKVGVVHRDLQPRHVFLHKQADGDVPTVKLVEFGISRIDAEATLSAKGAMTIGAPEYIAPEQAYGRTVDTRTDIWAFGVLAFELLTGSPPFEGGTVGEIIYQVTTGQIPELPPIAPGIDGDLFTLVGSCLVRDVDRRLASIAEAATVIDKVLDRLAQPSMAAIAAQIPQSPSDDDGPTMVVNGGNRARPVPRVIGRESVTEVEADPRTVPRPQRPAPIARPPLLSDDGTPTDADLQLRAKPAEAASSKDDDAPDTVAEPKPVESVSPPAAVEAEAEPAPATPPSIRPGRKPSDSLLDPQSERAVKMLVEAITTKAPPPRKKSSLRFIVLGIAVAFLGGGLIFFVARAGLRSASPTKTAAVASSSAPLDQASDPDTTATQHAPNDEPAPSQAASAAVAPTPDVSEAPPADPSTSVSAAPSASSVPSPAASATPAHSRPPPQPVATPRPPPQTGPYYTPPSL